MNALSQFSAKISEVNLLSSLFIREILWQYWRWKLFYELSKPVHSLLLVKSIPTMRLDDSRPESLKAFVTCRRGGAYSELKNLNIKHERS